VDLLSPEVVKQLSQFQTIYIAYSGGVDSTVLLHSVAQLTQTQQQLKAIHCNHGVSSSALVWQQHCQTICDNWNIPLMIVKLPLKTGFTETIARQMRYQAFVKQLNANDVLLTAHHSDDNVETMFLNLFRGTSLIGVQGMPATRKLGNGVLLRPLLSSSKSAIKAYAKQKALHWVEDNSNQDPTILRNWIRHKLVPMMTQKGLTQNIEKSLQLLQSDFQLLRQYALQDLQLLDLQTEIFGQSIAMAKLLALDNLKQQLICRHWLHRQTAQMPKEKQILELIRQLPLCKTTFTVAIGNYTFRYYQNRLYLLRLPKQQIESKQCVIDHCELDFGYFSMQSKVPLQVTIAPMQQGLRCRPLERHHSQTLKKLLYEYRIPTHLRQWLPLIYCDKQLIAVGGVFNCNTIANHLSIQFKKSFENQSKESPQK